MKKIKLLSLLAIVPMLASCGGKPSKPRFASYGKEVAYKTIVADQSKVASKADFMGEKALGSGVFKSKEGSYISIKGTMNADKVSMVIQSADESEMKYDQKNAIVQNTSKSEYVMTSDSSAGSSSMGENSSFTSSIQLGKVDKKSCLIEATKESKEYRKLVETDKKGAQAMLDFRAKEMLEDATDEFEASLLHYEVLDKKEQKNYKFYENGNIFTVEVKFEKEESHKTDGKVDYVEKYKYEVASQVDFTNGKFRAVSWGSMDLSVEFKKDANYVIPEFGMPGQYKAGDKVTCDMKMASEESFTAKELTLKAFDLAGYEYFNDII